jgi:hypothetical protein
MVCCTGYCAAEAQFNHKVAERNLRRYRVGVGFELPKAETVEVVPNVPNSQESEVVVSV